MLDGSCLDQTLNVLEMFDNVLVGVLDVLANKVSDFAGESAHTIKGANNLTILLDDTMSKTNSVIIFSKVWSLKKFMNITIK